MFKISERVIIPDSEIEIHATAAQGPGGQNVNKSATAVHLRFDIQASSLPDNHKERLLHLSDQRVTRSGVIVIKSQRYRSFEDNREDALQRLYAMIRRAGTAPKSRKPTKPGKNAREKRMDQKTRRGRVKALRGKIDSRHE